MTLWDALAQPLTEWPSAGTKKTSQTPAWPCIAQSVIQMLEVTQQVQEYMDSVRPQLE